MVAISRFIKYVAADNFLRAIIGFTILLGVLYIALHIYWMPEPIFVEIPWFSLIVFSFLTLTSISVAFLSFGRYQVLRDPVSFWTGMAFSSLSIGLIFDILAWPGLLPEGRSIIASLSNTASVITIIVPIIPGILLIAAVLAKWPDEREFAQISWLYFVFSWLAIVTLIYILIVVFENALPVFITAEGTFTTALKVWNIFLLLLSMVGTVLSVRYHLISRDALPGYIAFFQIAFIFSSISTMIGDQRYDPWWYLNRVTLILGSMIVLFGLLFEYIRLLGREKDAVQRLQKDEEALNRAQAVAHIGSWRLDIERNILSWSNETYRIFEVPIGTPVTYETFLSMVHPEDREYVEKKWKAAMTGEPYDIEHRIVVNDKVKWVRELAEMEFNWRGQPVGGFGIIQDITERKLAEQHEKELEEKQLEFYQRTILAATVGKLLITREKEIKDMIGEPTHSWEITNISELAALRRNVADAARSAGMSSDGINRLVTCVTEAASNAIKHAGKGIASVHIRDNKIFFAVSDNGPGIQELNLPSVALVMGYSTVGTGGMGYKLMIASADKVYLATGENGTIVAAEFTIE
ncbi:MAG TPA: ATP-binding protein [Armatimonadota bacterium]|nr:ATP-binding protein [Armatimonadota bacterium]